MTAGVYMIRNTVTGRVYIGSSVDMQRRWRNHVSCFATKRQPKLMQCEWETYGADAFVFQPLEVTAADESALRTAEQRWLESISPERRYSRSPKVVRNPRIPAPPVPFQKRFIDAIQAHRTANETDQKFAARLGIDQGHWSRILRGKRRVSDRIAARFIRRWPDLVPLYLETLRAQIHGTATVSPNNEKAG